MAKRNRLGRHPPCSECQHTSKPSAPDECPNAWHYRACLLEIAEELANMAGTAETVAEDTKELARKARISAGCPHYGLFGTEKEHKTGEARCDQCGKKEKQIKREKRGKI